MQVANPFAHLIQQLGVPGRDPVGFVGFVEPVCASSLVCYRLDLRNFWGCHATLFNDYPWCYPPFCRFKSKLGIGMSRIVTRWNQWVTVGAALLGAAAGAIWANLLGAVAGAVAGAAVASLIPLAFELGSKRAKLKRRIMSVLAQHGSKAISVRDVMKCNGSGVPTDCFSYAQDHPFVQALVEYRAAFSELEAEHLVFHSKQASVVIGYVDPPNDWINEWAGRVYQQASRH